MTWCVANEEKFAYISDDEFKKRLEDLLKEENLWVSGVYVKSVEKSIIGY